MCLYLIFLKYKYCCFFFEYLIINIYIYVTNNKNDNKKKEFRRTIRNERFPWRTYNVISLDYLFVYKTYRLIFQTSSIKHKRNHKRALKLGHNYAFYINCVFHYTFSFLYTLISRQTAPWIILFVSFYVYNGTLKLHMYCSIYQSTNITHICVLPSSQIIGLASWRVTSISIKLVTLDS